MSKSIVLISKNDNESVAHEIKQKVAGEEVETSTTAYYQFFSQCGSWNAWIEKIARGRDYLSQQPLYNKVYCISTQLGRANADIINKSLEESKECFYFDGTDFHSIIAVHQVTDDWSNGWEINTI